MKSRLFFTICAAALAILVLFFIVLIAALIEHHGKGSSALPVSRGEIVFALALTLVTALISSLIAICFALPAAYLLARYDFPGKHLIDALLFLPLVLSPVAIGAMLLLFFNTVAGQAIERLTGPIVFETPAIVLAQFAVVVGLSLSLVKSAFEQITPKYESVAMTLGATEWQAFSKVLLPLSRNGIVTAFLLTWARAVGEFGATVMLAGATPMKTETLTIAIFLRLSSADTHGAALLILISLVISFIILVTVRTFHASGRQSAM
jgi:molybdate transport system permease protein